MGFCNSFCLQKTVSSHGLCYFTNLSGKWTGNVSKSIKTWLELDLVDQSRVEKKRVAVACNGLSISAINVPMVGSNNDRYLEEQYRFASLQ